MSTACRFDATSCQHARLLPESHYVQRPDCASILAMRQGDALAPDFDSRVAERVASRVDVLVNSAGTVLHL